MKFLVLGAGRIGYALVYDLLRSPRVEQIIVADNDLDRLKLISNRFANSKVVPAELDVTKFEEVAELMSRCNIAISCVDQRHNYELAKAALSAKVHFCDLGSSETVVEQQFRLNDIAKEQNLAILPELGLAPGMVSILAHAGAQTLDELYEIRICVGGVPIEPEEPFNYTRLYSTASLLEGYAGFTTVIRNGKAMRIPTLTEVEEIEFPKPFGKMESFHTAGGLSTLTETYEGKVQHLDYRTIRYPGHCQQMSSLKNLGFFDTESVELSTGKVSPQELTVHLMNQHISKDEPDVVLIRIIVTGRKDKKPSQVIWECIEYGDQAEGLTAMMRMTAFPASVIAQMLARNDISERGVLRQELVVPAKLFLAELAGRGINLVMSEREPVYSNVRPTL